MGSMTRDVILVLSFWGLAGVAYLEIIQAGSRMRGASRVFYYLVSLLVILVGCYFALWALFGGNLPPQVPNHQESGMQIYGVVFILTFVISGTLYFIAVLFDGGENNYEYVDHPTGRRVAASSGGAHSG